MFTSFANQIIFFLFIIIRNLIFGSNDDKTDEVDNKTRKEMLDLKIIIEKISTKNNILMNNNAQIISDNERLKDKIDLLYLEQNFMINYHNDMNEKNKLNKKNNNLRVNYLLLSFSSKVKNVIALTRIINFRKIVNCLLNNIIESNKRFLRKTTTKFLDILKPKDNQKFFYYILY